MRVNLDYLKQLIKIANEHRLMIYLVMAFISIYVGYLNLGTGMSFWIIMLTWLIVYLLFFLKHTKKLVYVYLLTVIVAVVFSLLVAFSVVLSEFNNDGPKTTTTSETSADGTAIANCTSTIDDKPAAIDGWKSVIYASKLESSTPDTNKDSKVRTFSYNGIKNKTEKNSLYVRIEKTDGSNITGFATTMEACSADNKTSKLSSTADITRQIGEGIVASTHQFHGYEYLHGAGDYRVDIYLKTTDGVWHLIDRMTDIKITE